MCYTGRSKYFNFFIFEDFFFNISLQSAAVQQFVFFKHEFYYSLDPAKSLVTKPSAKRGAVSQVIESSLELLQANAAQASATLLHDDLEQTCTLASTNSESNRSLSSVTMPPNALKACIRLHPTQSWQVKRQSPRQFCAFPVEQQAEANLFIYTKPIPDTTTTALSTRSKRPNSLLEQRPTNPKRH